MLILDKNKIKIVFVSLILLISTGFWSFRPLADYSKAIEVLVITGFCLFLLRTKEEGNSHMYSKKYVLLFMLVPFLSIIPCYFVNGQSPILSLVVLRINLCWLFYFVLHRIKISENDIHKILIFIAVVWVFLEIIQQFTYPVYYFYTRGDETSDSSSIEIRAGIYRYAIRGYEFAVYSMFLMILKYYNSRYYKYLWMALFFLVGIYVNMTRQLLVASIITIISIPMFNKINVRNGLFFLLSICFLYGVYLYKDVLFGDMIEMTSDQLEDNIRYEAYITYSIYEHWMSFVLGNGPAHINSAYGIKLYYLSQLGLYLSDIGIVGEMYKFGLIYVLVFVLFCIFLFRKRKYIIVTLKSYFLFSFIIIAMIFPFRNASEFLFFSCILYLLDLSIKKEYESRVTYLKNERIE
jgi:hypothetical protein